jgi:hypothetical protein
MDVELFEIIRGNHKSLQNFWTRLHNNQDRYSRKQQSSTCKVGQKLAASVPLLTCCPLAWPSGYCTAEGGKWLSGCKVLQRADSDRPAVLYCRGWTVTVQMYCTAEGRQWPSSCRVLQWADCTEGLMNYPAYILLSVAVHLPKCWKRCPRASVRAWTCLILFTNIFCRSACEMFLMYAVIAVF